MEKIVLRNITKQYGKDNVILKDFNLTIEDKAFMGITGKSGSGKSTLLKIIGMFDSDYSGDYYLGKENLSSRENKRNLSKNRNNYIGYISQDYNLIDSFSVFNNIAVPLMFRKNNIENIMEKVKEIAKRFDIDKLLDREAVKLSGGERQRVCIARALVTKPLIVIADEPTASLDKENTDIIINYLKEINKTSTIILASHDDRVIKHCDNVCCLDDYKDGLSSIDRMLKKLDK